MFNRPEMILFCLKTIDSICSHGGSGQSDINFTV